MKKILGLISLLLCFTLTLPLFVAASNVPANVYPLLVLANAKEPLDEFPVPIQTLNDGRFMIPTSDDVLSFEFDVGGGDFPDSDPNDEDLWRNATGFLFPFSNNEFYDADELYVTKLSANIYLTEQGVGNPPSSHMNTELPLLAVYENFDESSTSIPEQYTVRDLGNGYYTSSKSNNFVNIRYHYLYSPLGYTDENDMYYYGVLTLYITISLYKGYSNTIPNNIFLSLKCRDFFIGASSYEIIVNPPTTTRIVTTDIDDVNKRLDQIYDLINQIASDSSSSGGTTNSLLSTMLMDNKSAVNEVLAKQEATTEELKAAVVELQEEVKKASEATKDNVKEALDEYTDKRADKAKNEADGKAKDILNKVDIIDTGQVEAGFNDLFDALSSDSQEAVLTVPEFKLNLFGETYQFWDEFVIDIPQICDDLGLTQYLFWFRFTFYFAFGWFLYGKVNRIFKIILLDDVEEVNTNENTS